MDGETRHSRRESRRFCEICVAPRADPDKGQDILLERLSFSGIAYFILPASCCRYFASPRLPTVARDTKRLVNGGKQVAVLQRLVEERHQTGFLVLIQAGVAVRRDH